MHWSGRLVDRSRGGVVEEEEERRVLTDGVATSGNE